MTKVKKTVTLRTGAGILSGNPSLWKLASKQPVSFPVREGVLRAVSISSFVCSPRCAELGTPILNNQAGGCVCSPPAPRLNCSFWTPCTPAGARGSAGACCYVSLLCSIHPPGPVWAVTLLGKGAWSLALLGPRPPHL